MKSILSSFTFRLFVTAATATLLAMSLDWSEARHLVAQLELPWAVISVLLLSLGILLNGIRWSVLARAMRLLLTGTSAVRITFAGFFVGQVLPSSIGSDAVRLVLTRDLGLGTMSVVNSLVVDRIIALVSTLLFAGIGLFVAVRELPGQHVTVAVVLLLLASLACLLIVNLDRVALPAALASRAAVMKAQEWISTWRRVLVSRRGLEALVLASASQVLTLLAMAALMWAMEFSFPVGAIVATLPVATLLSMAPISINGWGVREGAMIAGLSWWGVGATQAGLLSVAFGLAIVAASLPGGVILLFLRKRLGPVQP